MKRMKVLLAFAPKFFKSKPVVTSMFAALLVAGMSVSAFASTSAYSDMGTAFQTGISEMITETMAVVAALVPVTIPLMGLGILVAYVVKFIKKIAK